LYIKALLEGLFPEPKKDRSIRTRLKREAEEKGWENLWTRLQQLDPDYAQKINPHDKVRIIRALEVYSATGIPLSRHFTRTESFVKNDNVILIGLILDRKTLYRRIEERVDAMVANGLLDEVKNLISRGVPADAPPFRALGYKNVLAYLNKEISLDSAIRLTKRDNRHYAKRQMTWFKKMKNIHWFSPFDFSSIKKYAAGRLE